ncbi:DUF6302 family protein [Streptomyces sp. NPDC055078]
MTDSLLALPSSDASPTVGGLLPRSGALVTVASAQTAPDYRRFVQLLANPSLVARAVAVRFPGAGEGGVLAVPAGDGRLGGVVPTGPRPVGEAVSSVLAALPGFGDARLLPDGRSGVLVVWGVHCPSRISERARAAFYGAGGLDWPHDCRSPGGKLALPDAVLLDALAHGSTVGTLIDCRLAGSEREVCERMAGVGRVLTGWPEAAWTGLVHEAVCRGLFPVARSQSVFLGPAALGLLDAWAAGVSSGRYAELAALTGRMVLELEGEVCHRLRARTPVHAVLRAHEAGLLHPSAGSCMSRRGP